MDPVSDKGLATPSLHHGCSTVDSESGWILVESKKDKSTVDTKENTRKVRENKNANDSDAEMEDMEPVKKKMKGSPPYDDDSNYYVHLHDGEEEEEEEENTFEENMKDIDNFMDSKAASTRPLKKRKTNKNEEKEEEDFDTVCNEMASLPAVEYAYSCDNKRVIFNYKIKDGQVKCDPKEPEVIDVPPTRFKLSKNTYAEIDAADGILDLEIQRDHQDNNMDINTSFDINRRVLLNNFHLVENDPNYNQFLHETRTLPKIYDAVYPAMLHEFIKPNHNYNYHFGMMEDSNWQSNGFKRQRELQREDSTFLMYELNRCGMMDTYKRHYEETELTLDTWRIPYEARSKFKKHELTYISLMLHDMSPQHYMDHLLPIDEEPRGKFYQFFSKEDDLVTARQKWFCAIKDNYKKFYEILLGPEDIAKITIKDTVMMYDILDIMNFINPVVMYQIHHHPYYMERLENIINIGEENRFLTITRHPFYYEWMYFGWDMLPRNFPLHKDPFDDDISHLSAWVHRLMTHEEYMKRDLFDLVYDARYVRKINMLSYDKNGEKWWELDTHRK